MEAEGEQSQSLGAVNGLAGLPVGKETAQIGLQPTAWSGPDQMKVLGGVITDDQGHKARRQQTLCHAIKDWWQKWFGHRPPSVPKPEAAVNPTPTTPEAA